MFAKMKSIALRAVDSLDLGLTGTDENSRSRLMLLLFNIQINFFAPFYGGNFLNGLYLQMGIEDSFIAVLSMITMLSNVMQLFAPLILERFQQRKRLIIWGRMCIQFVNIGVIGAISLIPGPPTGRMIFLLICIISINLTNGIISPGLSVWHVNNIPVHMRARYFSTQNILCGVISNVMAVLAAVFADVLANTGSPLVGLLALRVLALIGLVLEIPILVRIKEFPNAPAPKLNVVEMLTQPLKVKPYLLVTICSLAWHFTANIPGPYYSLYLLGDLKLPYTFLNLIPLLYLPFLIFASKPWTKYIQKTSWLKVLWMTIMFHSVHYLILFLVGPKTTFLYPVALICAYIFSPAINLCFSNLPYLKIPKENQSIYIGFYSAFVNLAACLGIFTGKTLFKYVDRITFNFLGIPVHGAQMMVAITGVMTFLASVLIMLISRKLNKMDEGA